MKATEVIRRDHRAAAELFEAYKAADEETRQGLEKKIFEALEAHEKMEDTFFYPAIEEELAGNTALAELELEQKELEEETVAARTFPRNHPPLIIALMDRVLAHAHKEEREVLDEADRLVDARKLEELGVQMEPESAVAKAGED